MEYEYDGRALAMLDQPTGVGFLAGRAGTGKSTLIDHWRRTTAPANTIMLAPTGVAALNIDGGETIHRFIHAKPGMTPRDARAKGSSLSRDPLYRALDHIIVDEAAMARADLIDCLDQFLQGARRSRSPFGGVRVDMVGDPAQLPPVVTDDDRPLFSGEPWKGPWFFQSRVLAPVIAGRGPFPMDFAELGRVHRQADPAFAGALDSLRAGHAARDALSLLNGRVDAPYTASTPVLAATNRRVDQINGAMMAGLPGPEVRVDAMWGGEWPRNLDPAPRSLALRPGARVMTLANDPDGLWANGTLGTLEGFDSDDVAVVRLDSGVEVSIGRHRWPMVRNRLVDGRVEPVEVGTYIQLPLRPAWAVTIHKSQGRTLDRMRLELPAWPLPADGQAYVALSRVRTLEGLSLNRPLAAADIHASRDAVAFMARCRAGLPAPETQGSLF